MSRFKKLYETLLENEDLYLLFPDMTGEWVEDKDEFIEVQRRMETEASDIEHLDAYSLLETEEEEDFDE